MGRRGGKPVAVRAAGPGSGAGQGYGAGARGGAVAILARRAQRGAVANLSELSGSGQRAVPQGFLQWEPYRLSAARAAPKNEHRQAQGVAVGGGARCV